MRKNRGGAILLGLIFGFCGFTISVFFFKPISAVFSGVFIAAAATLFFSAILDIKQRRYAEDDYSIGEYALIREGANLYTSKPHGNGMLYLTADELIFVSYDRKEAIRLNIPISTIKVATYGKVFRHLVGLKITRLDGSILGFVVRNPERYIERILVLIDEHTSLT